MLSTFRTLSKIGSEDRSVPFIVLLMRGYQRVSVCCKCVTKKMVKQVEGKRRQRRKTTYILNNWRFTIIMSNCNDQDCQFELKPDKFLCNHIVHDKCIFFIYWAVIDNQAYIWRAICKALNNKI